MTGTIRTLRTDKGFGFIKDEAGKEYFFHQSAVQGEGIGDLREGDSVEFEVGQGPKGPRAPRPFSVHRPSHPGQGELSVRRGLAAFAFSGRRRSRGSAAGLSTSVALPQEPAVPIPAATGPRQSLSSARGLS